MSVAERSAGMSRSGISPKTRWQVLARDGFRCRYCGAKGGDVVLVVDHFEPIARGGSNHFDNLVTACEPCNQGKSDSQLPDIEEHRKYQIAAMMAVMWLIDVWCEETGEEIDWMPNTAIYLETITKSPTFDEAAGQICLTADHAKREGTKPEEALGALWDRLNPEGE
jgi:rubredoxin